MRAIGLALALAAATATAAQSEPKLIAKVDRVTAVALNNRLVVNARGAVASGGWTQSRLHLLPHKPEADTEVIEFLASPPAADAVVIDALLPVTTTAIFPLPRYGIVQVKVVSADNAVVAPITMPPSTPAQPAARGP